MLLGPSDRIPNACHLPLSHPSRVKCVPHSLPMAAVFFRPLLAVSIECMPQYPCYNCINTPLNSTLFVLRIRSSQVFLSPTPLTEGRNTTRCAEIEMCERFSRCGTALSISFVVRQSHFSIKIWLSSLYARYGIPMTYPLFSRHPLEQSSLHLSRAVPYPFRPRIRLIYTSSILDTPNSLRQSLLGALCHLHPHLSPQHHNTPTT